MYMKILDGKMVSDKLILKVKDEISKIKLQIAYELGGQEND